MRSSQCRRGFSLIETLVVMAIIGILFGLSLAAIQYARQAAYRTQCSNRMKQIGLALQQYHDEHRLLPPGCSYQNGRDPYLHMSWCTRLLPFLEQKPLWDQAKAAFEQEPFFLTRPPHVGDRPQPLFQCPSDGREVFATYLGNRAGYTFYLGVDGTDQTKKDGLLYLDSKVRFSEITDGLSSTLLVGERPPSANGILGWWYAGWGQNKDGSAEMILGAREKATYSAMFGNCPPDANRFHRGRPTDNCDALHFWSMHPGGAHFLFADGSVHFLTYSADSILPALATRAGGEAVTVPD
jgi:prepilin-type N-terminal cleavage/methylation domain-containing protein/prepilin-type processing-associated H-X9-DG protein